MKDEGFDWEGILREISEKQCTPIIGEGACPPSITRLPSSRETARKWADERHYPLEDSYQLSRVAQFLAIDDGDESAPKRKLSQETRNIKPPDFSTSELRNTAYSVLADLNVPLYITTNYDLFMEAALKAKGKSPVSEFCRWNKTLRNLQDTGIPSVLPVGRRSRGSKYEPKEDKPLVYHLYGLHHLSREYRPDDRIDRDTPQSLVLTEKDYIDFAITLNQEADYTLPSKIRDALTITSLLLIGYSLDDLSFRILFQGVINPQSKPLGSILTVQLPPQHNTNRATKYLQQYASKMFQVSVYWGETPKFCGELRQHWDNFKKKQDNL